MANNEKKDGNVFGGAVKTAEVKAAEEDNCKEDC